MKISAIMFVATATMWVVSCEPSVQPQFSSAVAMLHSFWYEKASDTFAAIAEKDPTCGMAYWGIAMTYYHPIWQAPGSADLKAGTAAVEKAKLAGAKTQRERDYIAAIDTFYRDSDTRLRMRPETPF